MSDCRRRAAGGAVRADGRRWHNHLMLEPGSRLLADAVAARAPLLDEEHRAALRLFNGHLEGDPRWVIDLYGRTAVAFHDGAPLADDDPELHRLVEGLQATLPFLATIVLKERQGATDEARRGRIVHQRPDAERDTTVHEHGVRYAIDLLMHQDAGFYLDTRHLRRWLVDTSDGLDVLNTFAYTGSLGVAARAGGARRVLHTDLNRRYLNVAKASYALNGFAIDRADFQARDFWSFVRGLKLQDARFDRVILDPPFFSTTDKGTVDLNRDTTRLINRVRPLVRSGGTLVVVNNALFLSGAAFMAELEALCAGGWLEIDRTIDVPEHVAGYPATRRGERAVDPAPFVHSTKIVVLTVRHKERADSPP
jgi:23S rRNA (cytosine1962-C5)-methyltransferase